MGRFGCALVLAGLIAACGDPAVEERGTVTWVERDLGALAEEDRARLPRAREAIADLGRRLVTRLTAAIEADGLAAAIGVCGDAAPEIAREVAEERGIRLGRTSHRLRNPANAPPPWAREFVTGLASETRMDGPRVFEAADGRLGVLFPIRLASMCTACHGDANAIGEDVAARLDELYPEDRARDFAPGDLRGLFWVEVPAPTD